MISKSNKKRLIVQRLLFITILSAILLNFPIIAAVTRAEFIIGLPILFIYIFSIAVALIIATAVIIRKIK